MIRESEPLSWIAASWPKALGGQEREPAEMAAFHEEAALAEAPIDGLLITMMVANTILVSARLPLSILLKYRGDFNRWYPLYRQIPMMARLAASRGEILRKADRFLKRY